MTTPTGILFNDPRAKPTSAAGLAQPGAYYQYYLTQTTTLAPVYKDGALTVVANQTIGTGDTTLAGDGRMIPIYLNPNTIYRAQLYSAIGALLEDTDPYVAGSTFSIAQTPAEAAAGLTIVNSTYQPGTVDRYGNNTVPGVTDMSAAIVSASKAFGSNGGAVTFLASTYACASSVICTGYGTSFVGQGYSDKPGTGAANRGATCVLRTFAGSSPLFIVGGDSSSLDNIDFDGNNQGAPAGVNFPDNVVVIGSRFSCTARVSTRNSTHDGMRVGMSAGQVAGVYPVVAGANNTNAFSIIGVHSFNNAYNGLNVDDTSGTTFGLTVAPAATATSATLSGAWAGATGVYPCIFTETAGGTQEVRNATLTNALTTMTWTGGLAANCNASFLATAAATNYPLGLPNVNAGIVMLPDCLQNGLDGVRFGNCLDNSIYLALSQSNGTALTFTAAPVATAVTGTLNANWGKATGIYSVAFTETAGGAFEIRYVTLTNGTTTATWATGLTANCNAGAAAGAGVHCATDGVNSGPRMIAVHNNDSENNTGPDFQVDGATNPSSNAGNYTIISGNRGGTLNPRYVFDPNAVVDWRRWDTSPSGPPGVWHSGAIWNIVNGLAGGSASLDMYADVNFAKVAQLQGRQGSGSSGRAFIRTRSTGGVIRDCVSVNEAGLIQSLFASAKTRNVVAYSASITIDASVQDFVEITATNGTPFTINTPTNPSDGQQLTVTILNTFGVLGAVTWSASFKMSAWTQPANTFNRSITFAYSGSITAWRQIAQTGVDVPN